MKNLLLAILSKLAKKYAKKIANAQKWIDSAQAQFASAIEESEIAEKKFDELMKEIEEEMAKLQAEYLEAKNKKDDAVKFKEKIKSFLEE